MATDVAPFTLGISTTAVVGKQRVEGVFSPILERGTVIPASRVERYHTIADNQRSIRIKVFQGEHSACEDNQTLGQYDITGLRAAPAGEEAVDVRFTYDLNGILEVETTVVSTKKTVAMVIERAPGQLTRDQIRVAREAMARIRAPPARCFAEYHGPREGRRALCRASG